LSIAAGAVFHVRMQQSHARAEALPPRPAEEPYPEFDAEIRAFETRRLAALGFYAAGAVAAGVGIYLLLRRDGRPPAASIGAAPAPGGGAVFARWSF
jgi:hypothetical protein